MNQLKKIFEASTLATQPGWNVIKKDTEKCQEEMKQTMKRMKKAKKIQDTKVGQVLKQVMGLQQEALQSGKQINEVHLRKV